MIRYDKTSDIIEAQPYHPPPTFSIIPLAQFEQQQQQQQTKEETKTIEAPPPQKTEEEEDEDEIPLGADTVGFFNSIGNSFFLTRLYVFRYRKWRIEHSRITLLRILYTCHESLSTADDIHQETSIKYNKTKKRLEKDEAEFLSILTRINSKRQAEAKRKGKKWSFNMKEVKNEWMDMDEVRLMNQIFTLDNRQRMLKNHCRKIMAMISKISNSKIHIESAYHANEFADSMTKISSPWKRLADNDLVTMVDNIGHIIEQSIDEFGPIDKYKNDITMGLKLNDTELDAYVNEDEEAILLKLTELLSPESDTNDPPPATPPHPPPPSTAPAVPVPPSREKPQQTYFVPPQQQQQQPQIVMEYPQYYPQYYPPQQQQQQQRYMTPNMN